MEGGVEFSPCSAESGELLEVGEIRDEEGEADLGEIFDESLVTIDSTDMFNESVEWDTKYDEVRIVQEKFLKIATIGDLSSIYRNRPIWTAVPASDLIEPCINIWNILPTARAAAMGFTSLLIHENTHLFFTGKENAQLAGTDFSSVENAALALLKFMNEYAGSCGTDLTAEVLRWCCATGSELSEQNKGRLIADNSRSPKQLFDLFLTVSSVKELIHLLNSLIRKLLDEDPDKCMTVLFEASRFGADFNWIWQHIVSAYTDAIVNYMFLVGSQQFHIFVYNLKKKDKEQVHPAILNSMLDDYNRKFSFLSEVFNFISHKGNSELKNKVSRMIQESLENDNSDQKNQNLNMVYFFKLVTCSAETLRILISQYLHLANPINFIRGIHQVLSVDKRLVLPTLSYSEFSGQMLAAIDSKSLGIIFKVIAYIAFDDNIFNGLKYLGNDTISIIKKSALIAVETVINSILNIAHNNETSVDDPPLRAFASDAELQFIIDVAVNKLDSTPILLRYLHSLTIKLGELKGAEIVARILFICEDKTKLSIIPAFLYTICPFYPNIMQVMYRNLLAFRSAFLEQRQSEDIDILIVANLQIILSWEISSEENSPHKYFRFNPGFYLGELLADLLSTTLEFIAEQKVKHNLEKVRSILHAFIKLLTSLSPSKTSQIGKQGQIRTILFTGRYAYKTAIQLAAIVKSTLIDTTSKNSDDLKTFRRLCSAILDFYSNYCNALMDSFFTLFIQSYIIGCMQDSNLLFGEDVMLNPWIDPSVDKEADIDDEYSFLDAVEKMSVRKKVVQLAHSGIIGKGARRLHPLSTATVDQYFRREVFVDSIRTLCIGENVATNISNCKVLANLLTELFCQDALSGEMLFGEWELEKETIARYLEILHRYNASSVGRSLLNIVSENKPCLWYCLPILKAVLASILNRFEGAVHKSNPPLPSDVDQLDSLVFLLRQADLLPQKFEILLDIVPEVSNYEGFLLVMEVWKYYQRRTITISLVNQAVISMQKNSSLDTLMDSWEGDFEVYRLVIQKHIVKLGYLFPILFKSEIEALSKNGSS